MYRQWWNYFCTLGQIFEYFWDFVLIWYKMLFQTCFWWFYLTLTLTKYANFRLKLFWISAHDSQKRLLFDSHIPYLIQLFILNVNLKSILRLIQRFLLYFNFLRFLLIIFLFITKMSANCCNFRQESCNRTCDIFVFIVSLTGEWRSKSDSKWKMATIWRPLD